ncbi:MAG: iron transporter [Firmicutes bacterium]|nr:iron transporter [Bacillota bacterium]MBR4024338.1 iron transporter [Bacillota bacterium]MBR6225130.1 iron transporter [Bacillota bacterium]
MKSKKLLIAVLAVMMIAAFCFTGCGGSGESEEAAAPEVNEYGLADNTYVATFTTDNGMFHVNEANNNKGILTVENGKMTIHVSLAGKGILNLYPGLAEDAQKEGAVLLEPTTDTVVYSDGMEEEVYGFDIPVPAIGEEFDCALVGKKGKWYDHKVMVSDPVEGDDIHAGTEMNLENGEYNVELTLEGGSGKATVESPAKLVVENGEAKVTLIWSSPNYDYMIVDGEKLTPVNEEGNSTFEVPVKVLNEPFTVIGDTTAMSQPHEIEYKLTVTVSE